MDVDPSDVTIRPITEEDRAACLAVFESNVPRYFQPSERSELEAFLDAPAGPYFVMQLESGDVVGCGGYALADEGRRADLCWGMIRREHHGRGLGRRLTQSRIGRAVSHPGVEEIVLRTSQLTTGFYRSLGFELVAVEPDGFGPGLDRCEMRRRVGVDGG